jgi:SAM-dependent methyltransferase
MTYSYRLDHTELARYRAMMAEALQHEGALWEMAGIKPGAAVVDVGCGPGAFLLALAEHTAPDGAVTGVDAGEQAVIAARGLITALDLQDRVQVRQRQAQATGLAAGSCDVAIIRNVLLHNGPSAHAILREVRRLLRPGGHLLCVEADVTGLVFPEGANAEAELERRWAEMMAALGNDPALGSGQRLASQIAAVGFIIDAEQHRVDDLAVERSPAWTARQMMLTTGHATSADIAAWETAIDRRLRTAGLLRCRLPLTAVVAHPR